MSVHVVRVSAGTDRRHKSHQRRGLYVNGTRALTRVSSRGRGSDEETTRQLMQKVNVADMCHDR